MALRWLETTRHPSGASVLSCALGRVEAASITPECFGRPIRRGLTGGHRPLYSAGFATLTDGRVRKAPVAELVDALDSKSSSARSAGSIPARGTIRCALPMPDSACMAIRYFFPCATQFLY